MPHRRRPTASQGRARKEKDHFGGLKRQGETGESKYLIKIMFNYLLASNIFTLFHPVLTPWCPPSPLARVPETSTQAPEKDRAACRSTACCKTWLQATEITETLNYSHALMTSGLHRPEGTCAQLLPTKIVLAFIRPQGKTTEPNGDFAHAYMEGIRDCKYLGVQ